MAQPTQSSAWQRFWESGGLWRAVLLVVVYVALYLAGGRLVAALFDGPSELGEVLESAENVFLGLASPLVISSLILVAFLLSLGWVRHLFARQPVPGRWWMWAAPLLVLALNLLRIAATDWSSYAASIVVAAFASGLLIGFAEEVLCRGIVVELLRRGGHGELFVAVFSSLLFALIHTANLFSGMSVLQVAITVVFTFGFGAAMYLTLRATGHLIWPILLHALTDPATFLLNGGIDEQSVDTTGSLADVADLGNFLIVGLSIVLLLFVRGRVSPREPETSPAHA